MRNIKSSQIIEGLSYNRSGKIDESISKRVKGDLENYWKTQKTPSSVRKMINNIVNYSYSTCTHIAECEIKKLARNSEDIYEGSNIRFQFKEGTDIDHIMTTLSESLRVEMSKNFSEYLVEGNSTILTIDHSDEGGYSVVLESVDDCIEMFICHMKEQIHEGAKPTQSIKYFKGKNPWDRFTFIFTPYKSKDGSQKIKVSMENTYWDSSDYAFVDANKPLLKTMTSYSDMAVKKVRDALRVAEFDDRDFENIKAELHMNEGLTCAIGTEVGLPIDRENCEEVDKEHIKESAWSNYSREDRSKFEDYSKSEIEFEDRVEKMGFEIKKFKCLKNGTTLYNLSKDGNDFEFRFNIGNKSTTNASVEMLIDYYNTKFKTNIHESATLIPNKLSYVDSKGTKLSISNLGDEEDNILTDLAEAEPENDNDIIKALNKNKNIYGKFSLSKRTVKNGCVVKVEDKDGNTSFLTVSYKGVNESKENESTDVSGVATPTGKLTDKEHKNLLTSDLEEEGLVCPECGSADINTRDNELLCAQCGYAWKDKDGDGEENEEEEIDQMINNDKDEKPLRTYDVDTKASLAKEVTSSTQGVHEDTELEYDDIVEGLSKTASGLRDGISAIANKLGEVEYYGESSIEINTKKSPKQIVVEIDKFFKKNGFDTNPNIKDYRIEIAGEDMFYMWVSVSQYGETTKIDYEIAM